VQRGPACESLYPEPRLIDSNMSNVLAGGPAYQHSRHNHMECIATEMARSLKLLPNSDVLSITVAIGIEYLRKVKWRQWRKWKAHW
jgi:hypothetical protein